MSEFIKYNQPEPENSDYQGEANSLFAAIFYVYDLETGLATAAKGGRNIDQGTTDQLYGYGGEIVLSELEWQSKIEE